MKSVSIRMPDELLSKLRQRAAEETVKQDRRVSVNQVVVDILTKELKGGE